MRPSSFLLKWETSVFFVAWVAWSLSTLGWLDEQMATFMVLYLAHLIGDFPLQTNRIYELKSQSNRGILLHVAIHIMVAVILIKNPLPYWRLLLVLGIVHFIIDWTKLHLPGRRQTPGFILDQIAHFLSLILIASWTPGVTAVLPLWLLWLGILLILTPASLMLLWVGATDLLIDLPENQPIKWASRSLLPLSQKIGSILVLALTLTTLFYLI